MAHSTVLWLVMGLWIATGVVLGVVMGRRGHNAFGWLVIGCVLGPLAVAAAIAGVRSESQPRDHVLAPAFAGGGEVDVLVGLDGSPESVAALHAVLAILGNRVGRLSLAGVVDFDAATIGPPAMEERELAKELAAQEAYVLGLRPSMELAEAAVRAPCPEVVVLFGRPGRALLRKATEEGFDLIVVGTRGRGLSRAVLGSVATELSSHSKLPVLLAGGA